MGNLKGIKVIETVKSYLLKVFDLKEHELNKTLLLQLNIFLLITTLLIVKPTINSLFLSELSADALPLGYVLTAILALLGSYFYNKALEVYSLNKVIDMTLICSILSLLIFGFLFHFNIAKGFVLYIPYVWVAIFGLLTASQFWILANLVYNVREAKRVFGFIGAGAIAGGIFGGYLTSLLTNVIAAESLLFVAPLLLAFCLPITRYIWKNEVEELNEFQVSKRKDPKENSPFKLIKKSKLLSLIAIVVGISVLVAKLVDYQYSDYASLFFEDPDELAAFFGFWFSTLSVISLLIQLFLTKRVVGTFGVGKSLLWLPSGILLGSILLLFIPELWVIVFIKLIDGSLKQSVNKAATELLSIPIPIEIKKKTKTFTDVVIDSVATGLAGFILIFFINGLDISSTYISLIISVLIVVWLVFIYYLRKEYLFVFKKLLEVSVDKKEKAPKKEIPITSIVETVNRVLENGNESQVLHMLQRALPVKDERFFKSIKKLLLHVSPKVRVLAIENLYFLKTENLSNEMELLIKDSNQEVTTAAFRYLTKFYTGNTLDLFDKYLNSEDITISNAALISLSIELRNKPKLQDVYQLSSRVQQAIDTVVHLKTPSEKENKIIAITETIGNARLEAFYPYLLSQTEASESIIKNSAILNAGKSLAPEFIEVLIKHLPSKETRQAAIEGLFNYGDPIISRLYSEIKNERIDLDEASQALLVIEKFGSQKAINVLIGLTDGTEHHIKMEAIEAIKRLKWTNNNLEINDRFIVNRVLDECHLYQNTLSVIHSQIVLQHKRASAVNPNIIEARNALMLLLEQRLDRQLQRIFSLLGIKYPPEDIDPILNNIIHGEEEQRIHAIEFLDNILNAQLKRELIPVAESFLTQDISEEKIKKLNLKVYSEIECYQLLFQRKDVKLKLAVLYLIEQTEDSKFIPLLEIISKDTNDKVRNRALEVLKNH